MSPPMGSHTQVSTTKKRHSGRISRILRPAETEEDSIVGEIEWKRWDAPTMIRSHILGGLGRCTSMGTGVIATDFLYKRSLFSS